MCVPQGMRHSIGAPCLRRPVAVIAHLVQEHHRAPSVFTHVDARSDRTSDMQ